MRDERRKVVLSVLGMRDNSSRERVAESLGRVVGVREATVSLIRSRAIVVYGPPCEPEQLIRAVESAECSATLEGAAPAR